MSSPGEPTASITFKLENAEEVLQLLRELKGIVGGGGSTTPGTPGGAPAAPGAPAGMPTAAPPSGAPPPSSPVAGAGGANPANLPQNNVQPPGSTSTGPGAPTISVSGSAAGGMSLAQPPAPATASGMFGYWNGSGFSSLTYDPTNGRFFDPATGAYQLNAGWPGGGTNNARPPQPPRPDGFGSQMAAIGVGSMISQAANQAAGQAASAQVNGEPFYWQRLGPAGITIGAALTGAAIGSVVPGLGTVAGGLVGAGVGALAGSALGPFIERGVQEDQLRRTLHSLGMIPSQDTRLEGMTTDVIDMMAEGAVSGRYLPRSFYESLPGDSPVRRRLRTRSLTRAAYGVGNMARRGLPEFDESYGVDDMREILEGDAYGNELETAQALSELGYVRKPRQIREQYRERVLLERETSARQAEGGLAAARFGRATRYGGSAGAIATEGAYATATRDVANGLRRQADMAERSDPFKARELRAQAAAMELQGSDERAEAVLGAIEGEMSAAGTLAGGRASRAFDTALYSGASAGSLPWGQRAGALNTRAGGLESLREERRRQGRLSPAEDMRMQEEIESLRYQATTGLAREREGMMIGEARGESALRTGRMMSAAMPGILRGSAVEQTQQFELQGRALEEQVRLLTQILDTSRYLTREQRLQLEAQREGLKVEKDRVSVAGAIAKAGARYMTSETANVESGVSPSLSLIRGAGGAEASEANVQLIGATERNLAAKRGQYAELRAAGLDEDNPEVQKVRREIVGLTLQRETQNRSLATVPMSGEDRARRSDLETQSAFYQAGYGSFGDVRGNLAAQIRMSEKRIDELNANRRKMQADGRWTSAMEGDFTEARNAEAMRGLQLGEQYNEGWDQRLISQAYNMPGNGRLMMSRFTRMEAAASGILHRAFGGSEEQTRYMREFYPRMQRNMGSGNPANFIDRAVSGPAPELNINLRLVDSNGGRIQENSQVVSSGRNAAEFNFNLPASRRTGG